MDLGVLTVPFGDRPLDEALSSIAALGVDAVELGCGGFPGSEHCSPATYLDDESAQRDLRKRLADHDLSISALATHNNPLHPDDDRADHADTELRRAIRLAAQLDVDAVTCFSGLPAGAPADTTPNWITAPWPPEHREALDYQWDVATEYWIDVADVADDHGVAVAIEMHPNMLVHEPHGLLRLREAVGTAVGANFDPSHLYWQGIDPVETVRMLGERDAIHHVHAKDTEVFESIARTKGVLDTTDYDRPADRSWLFRTVGYGHGETHWKRLVSALRLVDYDGAVSIEHEDALTSSAEGLAKAVDVLDRAIFETQPEEAFWAE